jgi:hypothetical protein
LVLVTIIVLLSVIDGLHSGSSQDPPKYQGLAGSPTVVSTELAVVNVPHQMVCQLRAMPLDLLPAG